MPIYEFTCKSCGHNFEKLCKMSDNIEEISCPACGATGVKKRISAFASPGVSGGSDTGSGCGSCASHNCSTCGH